MRSFSIISLLIQFADGRIAVAGPVNIGAGDDIGLKRYLSDGSPDPGSVGSITDAFNSYRDVVGGIAEGLNGTLVVCGWFTPPTGSTTPGDLTVVRYNADGTLDQSFGAGGKVVTDIIGGHDYAQSAIVQPDGKIIAIGDSANPYGSDIDFTLVRYNVDGSLDSGFGSNGKVRTDVGTAEWVAGTGDLGYGAVLQPDGRLVVTGSIVVVPRQRHDFGLVRYFTGEIITPPPPTVGPTSFTINPTSVDGGAASQGLVTLNLPAPAGGAVISLSSSNASVASVQPSVTVPEGATGAVFLLRTVPVASTTSVSFTASYGGGTRTAWLTVRAAPTTDTVAVQRAEYTSSKRMLRVEATSTNANVVLNVYVTSTNQLIGTLTRNGGKYSGQFSWQTNPQNITVKSSSGGSVSRAVSTK